MGEYLRDPRNREVRRVTFPVGSPLEMAMGTLFLPVILSTLVFNFINPDMLLVIIPLFCTVSLGNGLLFPLRFIPNIRVWSLLYASLASLLVWTACEFVLKVPGITDTVAVGLAAVYFVNEFEGWSPLVKFSLTGAYASAEIRISVNRCTGCGACIDVCPKGVYSMRAGKSTVTRVEECCSCKSCFFQCPAGAITHSASAIDESLG